MVNPAYLKPVKRLHVTADHQLDFTWIAVWFEDHPGHIAPYATAFQSQLTLGEIAGRMLEKAEACSDAAIVDQRVQSKAELRAWSDMYLKLYTAFDRSSRCAHTYGEPHGTAPLACQRCGYSFSALDAAIPGVRA